MTKNPLVLIVEDDDWMAQQHQRSLEAAGMRTKIASHALAAIDALDAVRPDVIVLDVLLPGPNAFTLLHEMHSHADLAGIPVVLCTNSADQLVKEDLKAYGVRRVLDKTKMQPKELEAAVRKALL
ncbi:MAG TPA: response regulator [Candidatus Saccharimonadales bacterium]|nr:response regulator [Candidatus Saccharimonadales bacterium]